MEDISDLDNEWNSFMSGGFFQEEIINDKSSKMDYVDKFTKLNISTKTKIAFLTINNIDILNLFWKLNVMGYNEKKNGIIKKQIKISLNQDEKGDFLDKIEDIKRDYIVSLNNIKEIKKKYICKLNIGLSKKDLLNNKSNKGAFYNCFMIIIRVYYKGIFREINAKVFNTGKLSFPGMITDELLDITIDTLLNELNNVYNKEIKIKENTIETVLVNSNFTCGFYINRDVLADILKSKYNIPVYYDSCSYPGIQCKYKNKQTNKLMSFMIFRTGSILIVGKCDDSELIKIYNYIKEILTKEYKNISTVYVEKKKKEVIKKRKKRIIYITK